VFTIRKAQSISTMSKQTIQSSDEKAWSDVESNTLVISDDDALMKATGKVGELKR
jgi:choline transport protein